MYIKKDIERFIQICEYLGIKSNISTITDRIKIQKIFYILKKFGLKFQSRFNWYKYGPYSSYLADIYYQIDSFLNSGEKSDYTLDDRDKEILERANELLTPLIRDRELLEYYASLLFVKNDMLFFKSEKNEKTYQLTMKKLKPELYDKFGYKKPIKVLKEHKLIIN